MKTLPLNLQKSGFDYIQGTPARELAFTSKGAMKTWFIMRCSSSGSGQKGKLKERFWLLKKDSHRMRLLADGHGFIEIMKML